MEKENDFYACLVMKLEIISLRNKAITEDIEWVAKKMNEKKLKAGKNTKNKLLIENQALEKRLAYNDLALSECFKSINSSSEDYKVMLDGLLFYADKVNYKGSPSRIDMQDNGEKARAIILSLGESFRLIE